MVFGCKYKVELHGRNLMATVCAVRVSRASRPVQDFTFVSYRTLRLVYCHDVVYVCRCALVVSASSDYLGRSLHFTCVSLSVFCICRYIGSCASKHPVLLCTSVFWKSEWADYAAFQAWCGNLFGNELTHTLPGNIRPQLSQLVH